MITAFVMPDSTMVRVVVKGAPERVIPMCVSQLDGSNDSADFEGSGDQGQELLDNIVSAEMAQQGLKPIVIAYRDIEEEEITHMMQETGGFESEELREFLSKDLTLVATAGLEDKLREGIVEIVSDLYNGGTNTRILSGDHKESVIHTARTLNIVEKDSTQGVLFAEDLRAQLEDLLKEEKDPKGESLTSFSFKDIASRNTFKQTLQ